MKKLLLNFVLAAIIIFSANAQTQPTNAGFESWNSLSGGGEDPSGWASFNQGITLGYPELSFKTTDANNGSYAIKAISDTAIIPAPFGDGTMDTAMGVVFLGALNMSYPDITGVPYTEKPDIMSIYVKGTVASGGSCYVMAQLTKWNSSQGKRDTIGETMFMMSSSILNYQEQKLSFFYYSSNTPDTLNIGIFAGDPGGVILPGNEIFVDDISFAYNTSGNNIGFTYDTSNVCAPITINFTNTSNVFGAAYYEWRFNDGSNTVTAFDTSHIFTKGGNFWVELTAYDSMYNYLGSYGNDVYLMGGDLHVTATQACAGDEVYFDYYGDADDQSMAWDFGDGTTTNGWNASHAYTSIGTYNVTLTVNDNNCGWDTLVETISIGTYAPTAYFDYWNYETCPNDAVTFEARGSIGTYVWVFGDGTSDTTTFPRLQHTYTTAGNYAVKMTVTNCGGSDSYTDTIYIKNGLPVNNWIDFDFYPGTACIGDAIKFDIWSDQFSNLVWDFGDGSTDSTERTSHSYTTNGSYGISLKITNGCGSDTTLYDTVTIGTNIYPNPNDFEYGIIPPMACPHDSIIFYSDLVSSVIWNFGDGTIDSFPQNVFDGLVTLHAYADTGTYYVTYTLTNGCGNSMTDTTEVIIGDSMPLSSPFGNDFIHWEGKDGGGGTISTVPPCQNIDFAILTSGSNFAWDFGDGTKVNTNSLVYTHAYTTVGDYTLTVVVHNSCGDSTTITDEITIVGSCNYLFATASGTNLDCNGDNSGTATAAVGGGTSPYTYLWDDTNNQTTATATGLGAGTYSASVIDANNDTVTTSITLTEPTALTTTTSSTIASCGASDGTVTVSVSGGTASYNYSWSNGKTTSTTTGLSTGAYYVTVTDANGCTAFTTVTVNGTGSMSTTISTSSNETCGKSNGSATVSVSGGVSPITYSWSNGQTSATATGLSANSYTVTATDNSSCSSISSVTISNVAGPSVSVTGTDAKCSSSSDGIASAFASGGTSPYTYLWSNGGTSTIVSGLAAGSYSITATDANGCTASSSVTINVSGSIISISSTSTDASCGDANDGIAAVFVSGGSAPYTYNWSNGASATVITGLAAGNYSVTATDATGCTASDDIIISELSDSITIAITTTNANCKLEDGSATAIASGGTIPYSYTWSSGDKLATADSLGSGIYVVSVTDANGCADFGVATISDVAGASITVNKTTNVTCFGGADGEIDITVSGGTAPYDYNWSDGNATEDISNLEAGPYEIDVTDANGCVSTKSFTITEPDELTFSMSTTEATCDSTDGSATVSVSGGTGTYSYNWKVGSTTTTATGLLAGTYKVIVTDGVGCKDSTTAAVSEAGAPTISVDLITNAACDAVGGSIFITSSDTAATYNWSNGATTEDLIGVAVGTYDVTVTSVSGCKAISSSVIKPKLPSTPSICLVTVDSTTGTNMVVWDKTPGQGITAYNIYKESTQSNVYYQIGTVPYDSLSTFVDSVSNPLIRGWRYKLSAVDSCGNESPKSEMHKTMHLTINEGIGGKINLIWDHYKGFTFSTYYIYRYSLTNGLEKFDSLPNNLTSYTDNNPPNNTIFYQIEIVNTNGCNPTKIKNYNTSRSNTSALSDVSNTLLVSIMHSDETGQGSCDGEATVIVYGGTPPYSYQWDDTNNQTDSTASGLCAGNYKVAVTDNNGDTTSASVTILSAVGIDDIARLNDIKLYPNPSNGIFTIEVENYDASMINYELKVLNVLGQVVYQSEKVNQKTIVNLKSHPKGIYHLQIISDKTVIANKRVMVQ